MLVRDIMTQSPVCVTPRTRLADAIEVMYANDIRHLPVLDHQRLVGILSDRDLRSLWDPTADVANRDGRIYEKPVSELMSGEPITVQAEDDIDEAIDVLVEHRIGAVPVVNAEGVLVGIVSTIDVLKAASGKL